MADSLAQNRVAAREFAPVADLLYGLTVLLIAILPFELIRPAVTLPWFVLTDLELVVAATAFVWAVQLALAMSSSLRNWRFSIAATWDIALPILLFLLTGLFSAAMAPSYRVEALKFAARFATGIYAFILTLNVARTPGRLAGLLWALVLGAMVSALLGLLEAWNWQAVSVLSLFKIAPTLVGGGLRVSATFQYATIASMFFEMAVPVAIALAATAGRRTARALATGVACICSVVVVLTLTRSGVATLCVVLAIALAAGWRWPRWRVFVPQATLALLALLMAVGALFLTAPDFRARITTENDADWYGAAYVAPSELTVQAGDSITTTIMLHNTGQATWQPHGVHAYALGSRWLTFADRQELAVPRTETELPRDVRPGDTITLTATVPAPVPPGTYRLSWGMLQRDILWFRHRGIAEAETIVQVSAGSLAPARTPVVEAGQPPSVPAMPPLAPADDMSAVPPTLSRAQLWKAAWLMFKERPTLGAGPDNFRHLHGRYLGLAIWNSNIFANNLFLELLADLGAPGLLAFGWLILAVLRRLYRTLFSPSGGPVVLWAAGLGGSLLAFLIHGLLDYFLGISGMYLLFWMTLGLIVAAGRLSGKDAGYGLRLTR